MAPNWLGDCVMALPALRGVLDAGGIELVIVTKPKLHSFWVMVRGISAIIDLGEGVAGVWAVAKQIQKGCFTRAVSFSNSFRSGVPAWLAGVPVRRGTPGHGRRWMLTDVVDSRALVHEHQALEYFCLLGLSPEAWQAKGPWLDVNPEVGRAGSECAVPAPYVVVIPGAARGVSKQWPPGRFAAAIDWILARRPGDVVLVGSAGERGLCASIAEGRGPRVHNLAGRTSLPQMAAVLRGAALALVNDSGGMHLAAAVGTPVVAIYGITDPARTGPLGQGHIILAAPGFSRSRDVPRESALAVEALGKISVDQVLEAVEAVFVSREGTRTLTSSGAGDK